MTIKLPANDTAWPPPGHQLRYDRMRELAAWYSGSTTALESHYQGGSYRRSNSTVPNLATRIVAAVRGEFWGSASGDEIDSKRHLGAPQDVATLSSESLFADTPKLKVLGPVDENGDATRETRAAQARLERILEACNWQSTLLAAAEIASALGSTGLRIAFDKSGPINDRPLLVRQDADSIIPVYSWGNLIGVYFWQQIATVDDVVWRHLELHEGGVITHALYRGNAENIGEKRPLIEDPSKTLGDLAVDEDGRIIVLPNGGVTAVSIPNMLPDPTDRLDFAGRSDWTPTVLGLFDDLDRTFTQFMMMIEDATPKTFVADSVLTKRGAGQGLGFDPSQRVYRLNVPPAEKESGSLPITQIQFEMRVDQYKAAIELILNRIMHECGYNTDGDSEASVPQTATEYLGKNRRTLSTRDKKIRYWQPALEQILTSMLAVDVLHFPSSESIDGVLVPVKAFAVEVQFPEAVQPSQLELATFAKALKDADAASRHERVSIVHPDWDETQIGDEVERMKADEQVIDPLSIGTTGAGFTPADPNAAPTEPTEVPA